MEKTKRAIALILSVMMVSLSFFGNVISTSAEVTANSFANARVISVNAPAVGNLPSSSDHLFFMFTLTKQRDVEIHFNNPAQLPKDGPCWQMKLYDGNEQLLGSVYVRGDSTSTELDRPALDAGDYYIEVSGGVGYPHITHNFNIVVSADGEPAVAPSNPSTSPKLTLSETKLFMEKGDVEKLKANVKGGSGDITWSSLNTDVCTVDDEGNVKAAGEGNTAVKAVFSDGTVSVEAACEVSVTKAAEANNVTIKPTEEYINLGSSIKLNATVFPTNAKEKNVKWSSTDPDIASVDADGNVAGLKHGETYIDVVLENNPAAAASCHLIVTDGAVSPDPGPDTDPAADPDDPTQIVLVDSLTFNDSEIKLTVGNSREIAFTATPAEVRASDITWESSDMDIVEVDSEGIIYATGAGKAIIKGTARNGKIEANVVVKVYPPSTQFKTVVAGKKKAGLKWTKLAKDTNIKGYEIQYSYSSAFSSGVKTVKIKSRTKISTTIGSLKSGRTCYFRVRSYTTVGKSYYNSAWSKVRSVKIK